MRTEWKLINPFSVGVLSLVVALGACSTNRVSQSTQTQGEALEKVQANAITTGRVSVHSLKVIRILDLEETWRTDQDLVLQKLKDYDGLDVPAWESTMAVGEVSYLLADRASAPDTSQRLFLECILAAISVFQQSAELGSLFDPRHRLITELYNRGLARLITVGQELEGHPSTWKSVPGVNESIPITIARGDGFWDPAYFERIIPTDELAQTGIAIEHRRYGVGATMVGYRNNQEGESRQDKRYPVHITRPVTAILRYALDGGLILGFADPLRMPRMETPRGSSLPIAANVTSPLAYLVDVSPLYTAENPSFMNPEEFAPYTGLYMSEPYDPNKIPLVLVHGLWSSPLTWIQMTNEVWGDEFLREHFQVWYYAYPTGQPIIYNAAKLRKNLESFRMSVDPDDDDRASREMILVGHSMGGLLSNMQVKKSGSLLWDTRFTKPLDQMKLDDDGREFLREGFFFSPNPRVKRVVFVCSPHRGSGLADGIIGAIGSGLVTTPAHLEAFGKKAMKDNPDGFRKAEGLDARIMNSVDGLATESPLLLAVLKMPYPPGLPFHTICGNEDIAGVPHGTDGIVPYESSHLNGATSELIVHSNHSATGKPATMAEIRRIMRLHLKEQGLTP